MRSPISAALPVATGLLLSLAPPVGLGPTQAAGDAPAPSSPAQPCVSDAGFAAARTYARSRPGNVSFSVLERGELRSERGGVPYRSASLVKAMVLAADLRRYAAAGTAPDAASQALHRDMIVHSDNEAASAVFARVGASGLYRVARSVGMRRFRNGGYWGRSEVTASDQVRFWRYLNAAVPASFRSYAAELLRSIESPQTWGAIRVARRKGFATLFKSGWLPQPGGWIVTQGARLERDRCTIGLAVLTSEQPDMSAGVETMRGIAERLL